MEKRRITLKNWNQIVLSFCLEKRLKSSIVFQNSFILWQSAVRVVIAALCLSLNLLPVSFSYQGSALLLGWTGLTGQHTASSAGGARDTNPPEATDAPPRWWTNIEDLKPTMTAMLLGRELWRRLWAGHGKISRRKRQILMRQRSLTRLFQV